MKTVVIFFLCLCFHRTGRMDADHASATHCSIFHSSGQAVEETHQLKSAISSQHYIITTRGLTGNNLFLLMPEDDEEDDTAGKPVFTARYFSYACAAASNHSKVLPGDCFSYYQFASPTRSGKYILQRALRI